MAKYEILFRMLSDVRSVTDTRGNFLEHDVIVRTAHWSLETDLESGCFRVEGDYSDTYMTMDFPDDDAATIVSNRARENLARARAQTTRHNDERLAPDDTWIRIVHCARMVA